MLSSGSCESHNAFGHLSFLEAAVLEEMLIFPSEYMVSGNVVSSRAAFLCGFCTQKVAADWIFEFLYEGFTLTC